MATIHFLTQDQVLRLHKSLIEHYGGDPAIRDLGLLLSAISQPAATFGGNYLHSDLFEMAAAYLFHIVSNHPFVDGNKRTGAGSAVVFLDMNGIEIQPEESGLVEITLQVAQSRLTKPEIAAFFRRLAGASPGTPPPSPPKNSG